MAVEVLSFDLDDTLWEVKPVLIAAEKKANAFLQRECPELFERFSWDKIVQKRVQVYKSRPDLHHQISQLRIEATRLLVLDCGYEDSLAQRLAREAFDIFIHARHEVEYFVGVEDCLAELHSSYRLVALTNGNADVKRLPIGRYFDLSVKAEDINSSKPAAAHFELTLSHYDIDVSQMVHIGDHPEHDVLGAQQLGIATVWVNSSNKAWPDTPRPDIEIRSIDELPKAVRVLEQRLSEN